MIEEMKAAKDAEALQALRSSVFTRLMRGLVKTSCHQTRDAWDWDVVFFRRKQLNWLWQERRTAGSWNRTIEGAADIA